MVRNDLDSNYVINYSFPSSSKVKKVWSPGTVRCRLPLAML